MNRSVFAWQIRLSQMSRNHTRRGPDGVTPNAGYVGRLADILYRQVLQDTPRALDGQSVRFRAVRHVHGKALIKQPVRMADLPRQGKIG